MPEPGWGLRIPSVTGQLRAGHPEEATGPPRRQTGTVTQWSCNLGCQVNGRTANDSPAAHR